MRRIASTEVAMMIALQIGVCFLLGCGGQSSVGVGGEQAVKDAPPLPGWAPSDPSQKWQQLEIDDTPLYTGNQFAIVDLIDAIEHDREPLSSGHDAVAALEMILGAYESQITGKRVTFPMKNRKHPLERFGATGS